MSDLRAVTPTCAPLLPVQGGPFFANPGSPLAGITGGSAVDWICQKVAVAEPFDGPGALGTVVDQPGPPFSAVVCPLHRKILHKR